MIDLRPGDMVRLGKAASVQFSEPILFRLIRVLPYYTYTGWVWLDGYEMNSAGDAVERREVFVQWAGIQTVGLGAGGQPRNSGTFSGGRRSSPRPSQGRVSPSTRTRRTRS
jgi:hypothetical protein